MLMVMERFTLIIIVIVIQPVSCERRKFRSRMQVCIRHGYFINNGFYIRIEKRSTSVCIELNCTAVILILIVILSDTNTNNDCANNIISTATATATGCTVQTNDIQSQSVHYSTVQDIPIHQRCVYRICRCLKINPFSCLSIQLTVLYLKLKRPEISSTII